LLEDLIMLTSLPSSELRTSLEIFLEREIHLKHLMTMKMTFSELDSETLEASIALVKWDRE
jgi:hypothetical protein